MGIGYGRDRFSPGRASPDSKDQRMTAANLDTELRPGGGLHPREFDRGAYLAFDNNPYMMVRPPLLRRVLRASARFVFAALLGIGGTLAWQSRGDQAMDVIRAKAPSIAEWLPASTSTSAVPSRGAAEAQQPLKASLAATDQQSTPTAGAATAGFQQQLAPITVDLATLRQTVEQVVANQEKFVQSIARLEGNEQAINQKLSSLASPKPVVRAPQPKPLQRPGQASARARVGSGPP
jgi:hypothetical protein